MVGLGRFRVPSSKFRVLPEFWGVRVQGSVGGIRDQKFWVLGSGFWVQSNGCIARALKFGIDDLADGGDDVRVGAAAAEIAAHPLADLMVRAGMPFLEQGDGGADLPRGAEAALEGILPDESRLD